MAGSIPPPTQVLTHVFLAWTAGTIVLAAASRFFGEIQPGHFKVMWLVGAGLSFPSMMTIAMSGAEPHEAGLASGLVNTSMQVGGALGLAVLATLSASRAKDVLASGAGSAAAISSGLHLALAIGAGLVIAAIVVAAVVVTPARALGQAPAEGTEREDAPQLGDELYSEAA